MKKLSYLIVLTMLAGGMATDLSAARKSRKSKATAKITAKQDFPWVVLNVGPGLATASGASKFSTYAGAMARVSAKLPLYVGMDFGMNFLGSSTGSTGFSGTGSSVGFQFLPSTYYRFTWDSQPSIHPVVGLSTGLHILRGTAYYTLLFRPGVHVSFSRVFGLQFEPRMGLVDASFLFNPMLNAAFTL